MSKYDIISITDGMNRALEHKLDINKLQLSEWKN